MIVIFESVCNSFDKQNRAVDNNVMESKHEFKNRLINEGRWDEFVKYREKLKAEGIEAKTAWSRAREEFQQRPIGTSMVANDCADNTALRTGDVLYMGDFQDKPAVTARSVVQWVFDHIDIADVKPQDAPSSGAWSFLQRVRAYPELLKEFYRSIWAKMLPSRSDIEARERFEDDGRSQLRLITQIQKTGDKLNG